MIVGTSVNVVGTSDVLKQIGGAPFDGGRKELPGGSETSDPVQRVRPNSSVGRTDALPT